jgi:prohibitin 2
MVSKQIRDMLTARSADFRIVLDDVAITHLAFSKEYTAAVEAKQVAQQDSERSKYIVERALQEKKSIIIKAQGEAQAATLIGQAILKNPAFLELRKIDASKEVAQILQGSANKVYLNADNLMINTLGMANEGNPAVLATDTPVAPPAAGKGYW